MSSLIHSVSYSVEGRKKFVSKLVSCIGGGINVVLVNGMALSGVVGEVGSDYLCLIQSSSTEEIWLPFASLLYFSPSID